MTNQLIASVISIAIGWGLAWLVAKGISFLGRVPNLGCFYWFGGMWTLVAVLMVIRKVQFWRTRPKS
jgi:hypothetical protein